jgi:autotransporter-associated beta strand protein
MTKRIFAVAAAAVVLAVPAFADFIPTTGTASYLTPANWDAGNINGVFSRTLTGNTVVTFNANTTLSTGLTVTSDMNTRAYTLRGDGGDRTLTLGGDINHSPTGNAVRVLGIGAGAGQNLNVNPGGNRTFHVNRAGDLLSFSNTIVGTGDITKTGPGTLTLASTTASHNAGDFYINEGVLQTRSNIGVSGQKLYLGNTSGSANVILQTLGEVLINDVVVRSGSSGDVTFRAAASSNVGISGSVALQRQLTLSLLNGAASPSSRNIDLSGAISGSGGTRIIGAGLLAGVPATVTYSGSGSNNYTGLTEIVDGVLVLSKTGATAVTGNLVVGDGDAVGTADELRFAGGNQIADTSDVIVNNTAFVNLSTFSDTIDSLTLNLGSQVRTDAIAGGTLTMNSLTINGVSFGNSVYTAASGIIKGINFADYITGTGSLVVPEPSALSLLAVAGVGMLRRRK